VLTKGAVDSLLEVSTQVWTAAHTEPLDENWRDRIMKSNDELAANGMRVLGLAFCQSDDPDPIEENLIFIGMVGMIDPARPEVQEAVREAKTAGIRTVMITGDHPLTAAYIAATWDRRARCKTLTGRDLDAMTVEQLEAVVEEVPSMPVLS
jgi:Ca2+-transporting ATPase